MTCTSYLVENPPLIIWLRTCTVFYDEGLHRSFVGGPALLTALLVCWRIGGSAPLFWWGTFTAYLVGDLHRLFSGGPAPLYWWRTFIAYLVEDTAPLVWWRTCTVFRVVDLRRSFGEGLSA